MCVIDEPYSTRSVPMRKHKHTGTQWDFDHNRIEKKWNKRFGFKPIPGGFILSSSKIGFGHGSGEKVIMAHPEIVAKLKDLPTGAGIDQQLGRMYRQGNSAGKSRFIYEPLTFSKIAEAFDLLNSSAKKADDSLKGFHGIVNLDNQA